jgi:hypothetical protein
MEKSMIVQKVQGSSRILRNSNFLLFSTRASPVAGSGGARKRLLAILVKTKKTSVHRFVKTETHAPIQKTQAKLPVFWCD